MANEKDDGEGAWMISRPFAFMALIILIIAMPFVGLFAIVYKPLRESFRLVLLEGFPELFQYAIMGKGSRALHGR
jgi:hypothetical protein